MKSKKFVVLLLLVLLINVSLNIWSWLALEWTNNQWSIYGRAFFSIMPLCLLPFSEKIASISFVKVILYAAASATAGVAVIGLAYHPIWHSTSVMFLGMASHLIIFKSQVEWGIGDNGPEILKNFSVWQSAMSITIPGFVGIIIDSGNGRNGGLVVLTILVALLCIIHVRLKFIKGDAANKKVERWSTRPLTDAFRDKETRSLNLKTIFLSGSITAITAVMPLWAVKNGFSATQAGLILSVVGVCSFLSRAVLLRYALRENEAKIALAYLMWVAGSAVCAWPLINRIDVAVVVAIVFGLGWGAAQPISLGLYADLSKRVEVASSVWASRSFCISVSALSLPFMIGGAMKLGVLHILWHGTYGLGALFGIRGATITRKENIV